MTTNTTEPTVESALQELRGLIPGLFATVEHHLHGDINRPENVLKTINSAIIYVEGGYWFRANTLSECMALVRAWKEKGEKS